jgi:hypothetical protein
MDPYTGTMSGTILTTGMATSFLLAHGGTKGSLYCIR